jgi:hypothetical protein
VAVQVIGLDTAKHVFQVHGADASGRAVLRKRLRRAQIPDFFGNLPKCVVGIEATQGAHYWSRVIGSFGHEVRLIAPQFVKPYLKGQKNDARDAAATRSPEHPTQSMANKASQSKLDAEGGCTHEPGFRGCEIKEQLLIEYGEAVSQYSRATAHLPSATEEEREAVSAAVESAWANAERIYALLLAHREAHGC